MKIELKIAPIFLLLFWTISDVIAIIKSSIKQIIKNRLLCVVKNDNMVIKAENVYLINLKFNLFKVIMIIAPYFSSSINMLHFCL